MQPKVTRRSMVGRVLMAGALTPVSGLLRTAGAMESTPLDPKDPTAKALGYVVDATQVDSAESPAYKRGQKCGNCLQFTGRRRDATGGCNVFAGHTVPAVGWCKSYSPKTA